MKILLNEITYMGGFEGEVIRDNMYAGCVVKYNPKNETIKPCRKIMFTINEDGTVNDLLYDSPNYLINPNDDSKLYVTDIFNLGKLLKHFGVIGHLNNSEIREVFNYYLSKSGVFFKEDHRCLPLSLDEYATLEVLSRLSKKPTREEKKESEKFKTKIKTYTFR